MRFSSSAPGKAVLSGEYSVLMGAPAISMAVDCRARVTVESADAGFHSVISPGIAPEARFRCTHRGVIEWLDDDHVNTDQALLEHVWHAVQAKPAHGLAITLDTRPFFDPESSLKLGFGSSAALAAALTAAMVRAGSDEQSTRRDLLDSAIKAHAGFQNGKGSGVDVATAVTGGVIAYVMRPAPGIQSLQWPPGLDFSIMWSGKPASTAERLQRLERSGRNRAARLAAAKLVDASRHVVTAWKKARTPAIIESLQIYTAVLRRFSIEHGLGVFDAGHQELCEAADDLGLVYKPCGAGGGDIGIVFTPAAATPGAASEFAVRAGQLGFRRLDHEIEPAGLNYEH